MRRSSLLWSFLSALWLAACTVVTPAASGPARIAVSGAWLRPAAASQGSNVNSALYLTLTNRGGAADTLLGVQADFATAVELHETRIANEVMTMRPLPDGIEIPAGGTVALQPGGLHVMLLGVKEPLTAGETRTVVLQLAASGAVTVTAEVRQP